jgi:PHD/YefM family antitoxin component YafN of YafNO toxin-antitoxin module
MLKTTVIKFRDNFVSQIEQCIDNHEVLKVERERGENFVIIGEGDWSAIEETLYLNQIPGLAESIRKSADEPLSEGRHLEELDW